MVNGPWSFRVESFQPVCKASAVSFWADLSPTRKQENKKGIVDALSPIQVSNRSWVIYSRLLCDPQLNILLYWWRSHDIQTNLLQIVGWQAGVLTKYDGTEFTWCANLKYFAYSSLSSARTDILKINQIFVSRMAHMDLFQLSLKT